MKLKRIKPVDCMAFSYTHVHDHSNAVTHLDSFKPRYFAVRAGEHAGEIEAIGIQFIWLEWLPKVISDHRRVQELPSPG